MDINGIFEDDLLDPPEDALSEVDLESADAESLIEKLLEETANEGGTPESIAARLILGEDEE